MEELPKLITDLAYILIIAGTVTIIFKQLKQPLVLGYIVAGFLAGPYMPYTPSVMDHTSIDDWSQIGVIFLMFTLGLEFSFKKIVKMGMRPVIAAVMVMVCMMGVGNTVGTIFGWESMDRLFLGGMLAMSSTTIIYKAFDDLGLRSRKFASAVLSVLILEDILGILLMVILSAMAVSRSLEGTQLIKSMLQLGFFLILWFIVGIFLVPLFLRKYKKYINTETLLIVSVGLCFLLVVIASYVGYSPAFGAFMMGSILAETVEAERIEHTVSSLKDLFGAIFFVSVGMLVNPAVLVQYWLPILVITLAVIVGQMIFGSMSFLLSGNSLKDSLQSGFSLAQIGEFAFIIAALGQSLKVTSEFLYPVVVAVSIITTFFTPYMIKSAEPLYEKIQHILPKKINKVLDEHTMWLMNKGKRAEEMTLAQAWKSFLKSLVSQTAVYLTLCVAVIGISFASLLPLCRHVFTHWPGNIICGLFTFTVVAPFIRPIVMRKNNSAEAIFIRNSNLVQRFFYTLILLLKFFIGCQIIYYILNFLSPFRWYWHVMLSVVLVVMLIRSRRVKLWSIRIQRTFMQNLNSREVMRQKSNPAYGRKLRGKELHIASLTLPLNTAWGGSTLSQLRIGSIDNVHVVAIVRGNQRINIPGGNNKLFPADVIEVVGDDDSIQSLSQRMESEVQNPNDKHQDVHRLTLINIALSKSSPLCGHTLLEADLRNKYHCMLIGIEDRVGNIEVAHARRTFQSGDILWIVGEDADLSLLRMGI